MGFRLGRHRRVKRGDRVYVYWAGRGYDAEVVGFRSCSFVVRFLDNGNQVELPPYNHGLFYGFVTRRVLPFSICLTRPICVECCCVRSFG